MAGKRVTWATDSNGFTLEASHGRPLGGKLEPYYPCSSCSEPFFISDMGEFNGNLYGIECGDFSDKMRRENRVQQLAARRGDRTSARSTP